MKPLLYLIAFLLLILVVSVWVIDIRQEYRIQELRRADSLSMTILMKEFDPFYTPPRLEKNGDKKLYVP